LLFEFCETGVVVVVVVVVAGGGGEQPTSLVRLAREGSMEPDLLFPRKADFSHRRFEHAEEGS